MLSQVEVKQVKRYIPQHIKEYFAVSKSVVFLGASGAVGSAALERVLRFSGINKILLLGRRKLDVADNGKLHQQIVDVSDSGTYESFITGYDTAICTLGVGEPSKVSKEDFVKIDKTAVLDFATVCKEKGVKHFQLLSSIGVSSTSSSFYLRTKGELIEALEALNFERLSVFQPSMILTPTNRYGLSASHRFKSVAHARFHAARKCSKIPRY